MIDGWHNGKPVSYGLAPGKNGELDRETAQFAIAFEIVDGPALGETITWYGGFKSDAALAYTEKALRACGFIGPIDTIDRAALSDAAVRIKIETETYNGKTRQKVKAIGAGSGGAIKTADAGQARSFAASLGRGNGADRPMFSAADEDTSFP